MNNIITIFNLTDPGATVVRITGSEESDITESSKKTSISEITNSETPNSERSNSATYPYISPYSMFLIAFFSTLALHISLGKN